MAKSRAISRSSFRASERRRLKVLEGSKRRMNRVVAALGRADGVGAARIVRAGLERVVAPLSIGLADRVNGRKVDDVEAHVADGRQPADDVVERAVTVRIAALGAGKELVPAREFRRSVVPSRSQSVH